MHRLEHSWIQTAIEIIILRVVRTKFNMFYVTFLLKPKVNVVVPTTWIYQYEKQWEKFVNIGLNKNQTHRVFFTKNPRAWNGEPLPGYDVNFDLVAMNFPDEGCYEGKLIKFFGK